MRPHFQKVDESHTKILTACKQFITYPRGNTNLYDIEYTILHIENKGHAQKLNGLKYDTRYVKQSSESQKS